MLIEGDQMAGWQVDRPVRFITGDPGGAALPGAEVEAELGRLFSTLARQVLEDFGPRSS